MGIENDKATAREAIAALRARGVDRADDQLEHATPDQILAVCHRWDREQQRNRPPGPGVIVHRIRVGEFDAPPPPPATRAQQLRARFEEYAQRFPVDAIAETHAALIERRWPDDDDDRCPGNMVVFSNAWPVISMACDECGFEAGVGPRHLHVLDGQQPEPHPDPEAEEETYRQLRALDPTTAFGPEPEEPLF